MHKAKTNIFQLLYKDNYNIDRLFDNDYNKTLVCAMKEIKYLFALRCF